MSAGRCSSSNNNFVGTKRNWLPSPKGSVHASQERLSTRVPFVLRHGPGLALISSLPLASPTTMLASSSTLERVRSSPRHGSGAPNRHAQSSPLSHSHTARAFVSPSTDTLLQDSQPRLTKPRRKGLSWNIPWRTHRSSTLSSAGLIPPTEEVEKAEGNQATPLKTPWHHSWKTAFFGTSALSTCYPLWFITDRRQISTPSSS